MIRRMLRRIGRATIDRSRPFVLMYHRVGVAREDPWQLFVTVEHFREQIDALTRARRVVPLHALADAEQRRKPGDKALAAVTFDDGYWDVLANASPILHRHDCPMTLFVVTGALNNTGLFWWDFLTRVFLETPELPVELDLKLRKRRYTLQVGAIPAQRRLVHDQVWALLHDLHPEELSPVIEHLAIWSGCDAKAPPEDRVLTSDEVQRIASELTTIGAHTISHPSLPKHSLELRRREIFESRRQCEELIGAPVKAFSYPFGDHDAETVRIVQEAGFSTACIADFSNWSPSHHPLCVPRYAVGDWDGTEFSRRLPL